VLELDFRAVKFLFFPRRKDKDGNYFIERNGKHFDHILDFLRDDKYLPPKDVMKEVLKDAKYFGLYEYVYRLQPLHICEPIWTKIVISW
jgi:hypothetical protein